MRRTRREASFLIPFLLGSLLVLAGILGVTVVPTVDDPRMVVSPRGSGYSGESARASRISLLQRWIMERDNRRFYDEILEMTENFDADRVSSGW